MNEIPKVVFSKTLARAEWPESQIAAVGLAEEVARLKANDGGYLPARGGARFTQALSRAGVVDAHAYSSGAAVNIYRPRYPSLERAAGTRPPAAPGGCGA